MGSLVTGIGYIGARLAQFLLDSGEQVVGLDNLFSTDEGAVRRLAEHPRFTFIEGDVRDEGAVARAFSPGFPVDTVYHLAAQSSANPNSAPARYTEETNLIGSRILLDSACQAGVKSFVFGSSLQVYGRKVAGLATETRSYGPILDLSHLSKVHVEKLLEMYAINRGIRCVSARIGLVYGLGPVMKMDPRFMTAPNKFCMLGANGEPITVDASAYFKTGMIHVDDVARGMVLMGQGDGGTDACRVVNLAGEVASVAGVASIVERLAGARGLRAVVLKPEEEPTVPTVDFGNTVTRLGFVRQRSLEEGLAEVMEFYANHPAPITRHSPEASL